MRKVTHAFVRELLELALERNLRAFNFLEAGDLDGHRKNCALLREVLTTINETMAREETRAA